MPWQATNPVPPNPCPLGSGAQAYLGERGYPVHMTLPRAVRLLGASMRLTRLVVADDVPGQWWIKDPLTGLASRQAARDGHAPRWWRYAGGLDCPFCVGLWITAGVVVADEVFGDRAWWRVATTALAMNEAGGHLAARLGDTATDDDAAGGGA